MVSILGFILKCKMCKVLRFKRHKATTHQILLLGNGVNKELLVVVKGLKNISLVSTARDKLNHILENGSRKYYEKGQIKHEPFYHHSRKFLKD